MRRGVSLAECVVPGPDTLTALDRWAAEAGAMPALLPLWHRVQTMTLDVSLLRAVRDRGPEPMVYATSTTREPVVPYSSYLAGEQDAKLGQMADAIEAYGGRVIVRWDHEASMSWCPWGQRDPSEYIAAFWYVRERLPTNAKMYYCGGSGPKSLKRYHPGLAASFVGFDKYSRKTGWIPLAQAWAKAIAALREKGDQPIIVGEFGRLRGLGERMDWLRTLDDVTGVWAALYFDMTLGPRDDWLMHPAMRRAYI